LHAYIDGELDADGRAAFEEHLRACPDCTRELEMQQSLRTALRDGLLRYRPPDSLPSRVQRQLRREASPATAIIRRWQGVAAAVLLLGLGLSGWAIALVLRTPSADLLLAREVAASHARSLLAEHLVDVNSTDRHTVKPWFQGRIDFAPPVPDFADQGFRLVGGRLDDLDGRTAAALVYRRRRHVINLFVWPERDGGKLAERTAHERGYNIVFWTQSGLNFAAVSDVNLEELRQFVQLVRAAP
jgi:anti-sigma factor RsiW